LDIDDLFALVEDVARQKEVELARPIEKCVYVCCWVLGKETQDYMTIDLAQANEIVRRRGIEHVKEVIDARLNAALLNLREPRTALAETT